MKRTTTLAGGIVVGVTALALAVPQLAGAEESPTPQTEGSTSTQTPGPEDERPDREGLREERSAELASRLADELGLEQDEVSTALDTVLEQLRSEHQAERQAQLSERLDQAVESGRLTREQADAILEAAEQGGLPGSRGPHGGGGYFGGSRT